MATVRQFALLSLIMMGLPFPVAAEASWWGGTDSLWILFAVALVLSVYMGLTFVGSGIGIAVELRRRGTAPSLPLKVLALLLTGINLIALFASLLLTLMFGEMKITISPLWYLPSLAGVALPLAWSALLFRARHST